MGICKIYWDDTSYLLNDDNQTFSIQTSQGTASKLIWDGGGSGKEHTIRNPTNYSYSFVPKPYNGSYIIEAADGSGLLTHNGSSNAFVFWGGGSTWTTDASGYISGGGFRLSANLFNDPSPYIYRRVNFPLNDSRYLAFTPGSIEGAPAANVAANNWLYWDSASKIKRTTMRLSSLHGWWINVVDGGQTYSYTIVNRQSVQTIFNSGSSKIVIEGKQFNIINTSSAYKSCIELCPNGTVTCDCGANRCCYQKTDKGYQLVKTIKL